MTAKTRRSKPRARKSIAGRTPMAPPVTDIMRAIIEAGVASPAELIRDTGHAPRQSAAAIRALTEKGWITTRRRGGATRVAPQGGTVFVLGCDLGGSKLHIAVADLTGTLVAEAIEQTDRDSGRAVLAQIRRLTSAVLRGAGIDRERILGATLGMPGVIEPTSGALSLSPNIPDFGRMNVIGAMSRAFGCPVRIENDVNLAVIGEHWRGAGRGRRNLAFIALGTGIGMGLLCDGRLVRGAHGAAAEIAYLPMGGDPFAPENIAAGTFESMVGTAGVLQRFAAAGGGAASGVRAILEAAQRGDGTAARVIDDTARWTALGIAAVVALVDPEMVVLGGGIGTHPPFVAQVERHLATCVSRPIPVAICVLGNRATLIGAVATAIGGLPDSLFGKKAPIQAAGSRRNPEAA